MYEGSVGDEVEIEREGEEDEKIEESFKGWNSKGVVDSTI